MSFISTSYSNGLATVKLPMLVNTVRMVKKLVVGISILILKVKMKLCINIHNYTSYRGGG